MHIFIIFYFYLVYKCINNYSLDQRGIVHAIMCRSEKIFLFKSFHLVLHRNVHHNLTLNKIRYSNINDCKTVAMKNVIMFVDDTVSPYSGDYIIIC